MVKMELKRLHEIFDETKIEVPNGDTVFNGLVILSKYSKIVVCAAEHDIIYSCGVDVAEHMSEEDAMELRRMGWMIEEGCFSHFV